MHERNEAIVWMALVEGWSARDLGLWFNLSVFAVTRLIHRAQLRGWNPVEPEVKLAGTA